MANPIYSIYIKHYTMANGSYTDDESYVYGVPFELDNEYVLVDPKVKGEMGKAGTFEFSLYYGHPLYNSWHPMKTMMRVEYYGYTIFYGRVLTIDIDHISSKKTVHCEGYLAFLIDSVIKGEAEEKRERTNCLAYITKLINNHNSQMAGTFPTKKFELGYLPGRYSGLDPAQEVQTDDDVKYGSDGFTDTSSALNSLTNSFGGFLRARYVNGTVYLDWLDSYFNDTVDDRVIEVTKNVVSLSSSEDVENIFTVVLPIGKNTSQESSVESTVYLDPPYIKVPDIIYRYSDAELNDGYHSLGEYSNAITDYGIIYKTVNFPNADTVDKLESYAWDWVKEHYHGGQSTFTATAIDLRITGDTNSPLLVGDRCTVMYPGGSGALIHKTLTITRADYDIHHPDKNSYTIGVPQTDVNKTYGESMSKQTDQKTKKTPKTAAGAKAPTVQKVEPEVEQIDTKMDHFFELYTLKASETNAEYQAYKEKYGDEAAEERILRATALMLDQAYDADKSEIHSKKTTEARRKTMTMLFDAKNGTMTGFNKKLNENFQKSVFAPYANEVVGKMEADTYATQASMVLDVNQGFLTLNDVADWDIENVLEKYKNGESFFLNNPAANALRVALAKKDTNANTDKYGEIALSRVSRNKEDLEDFKEETWAKIEGATGKYVGTTMQLGADSDEVDILSQVKTIVDGGIEKYVPMYAKGTFNADGRNALLTMTNKTSRSHDTVEVDGDGTEGEGNIKTGFVDPSTFRNWMNKKVTYLDNNEVERTMKGFLVGDDVKTQDYDSLNVRLLVVSQLIAEKATIKELVASEARVEELIATKASINDLDVTNQMVAAKASIEDLNVTNQRVSNLEANTINTEQLNAVYAYLDDLQANKATVDNLNVTNANVGSLTEKVDSLSEQITNGWQHDIQVVQSAYIDSSGNLSVSYIYLTFVGSVEYPI